ncbi:MAG: GTPase HflX, partial [Andreesenia angusta]|nr:GTPase HflX [Andreesenia angusta]
MGKNEENRKERVFLVGVSLPKDDISIESSILELEELANAANVEVIGSSIQNRTNIDNSTYIGKGKAYELKNLAEELNIDTMIFNNELSGGQIRNL